MNKRHVASKSSSSSNVRASATIARRGRNNRKEKKKSGILAIVAGFCIVLVTFYSFGMRKSGVSNEIIDHHEVVNNEKVNNVRKAKHILSNNNSYEGWQPIVNFDKGKYCNWRTCFKNDEQHSCHSFCRTSLEEMGKAPPRPGFQPDPNVDDEENNMQAQAISWIPDVTVLRRMYKSGIDEHGNPWPPPLVTDSDRELCGDIGVFGGRTDQNKVLLDAVPIQAMPLLDEAAMTRTTKKMKRQPKILCMVYTMEANHHTNIRTIRETWGPGCDGFLAFSTKDDPRIPSISLPHDGPEEYGNMWQKVRSIWRFVGTHYLEDFDFFFQGGEDLYVLPQNLRNYLADAVEDPTKDDFFGGRRFQNYQKLLFNSGGAGYALSQATLRKFVNTGLDHPKCNPKTHSSMEDVFIAKCLKDVLDIGVVDTRDMQGRERFHPFSPGNHYYWMPPGPGGKDWYEDYNVLWPPKLKEECCAPDSVSFHYMKSPAMVRHIHALLYFCD